MTTTSTTLCRITLAALVAVLWLCLPTASLGQERAQTFEDAARLGLQPTPTPLVVEQPPAVYKNAALTFYTNRATFEATFPDLTEEDFEGAKTPPNNVCSDLTPLNSSTNDACYGPGAIVDGFEFNIDGNAGPPIDYALLTTGFFGAPSNVVGPNTFLDNAILDFTGADPVFAAGFNATCIFNPGPITVEVFGPGGSLGSTTFTCPSSFPGAFVGVSSDADEIVSIEFSNSGAAAEVLDDILFGGTVTIDLSLDKDVDSFNEATRRITWEITVENDNGNDTEATGVVVRDDFPAATL
ncbi:MAG: hypothetical protein R3247_10725, partial [Rhodothermales bacterium]|nr:hypothetical protein [Rhodothermales bacterium]